VIAVAAGDSGLRRSLGLFDSTMIVAGSMIGSGIFIVSAEMGRVLGSPGWLIVSWLLTGLLTMAAALSYGELAAMMPRAGGQYIYLREAFSPLWGFLYGWTLFLVIQTGTIAAVGIGFARYFGILWPAISETTWLISPIHITKTWAVSLSTAQLAGVLVVALLTLTNMRGVNYGRAVQNVFTTAKLLALALVIGVGFFFAFGSGVASSNFTHPFAVRQATSVSPGLAPSSGFGLLVAMGVAQVGSLFSADAWNNITFTAGEARNPGRNVPLSLAAGTAIVIGLYILANCAYLMVLPLEKIQNAPSDRVAGAMLQTAFPQVGGTLMALTIMISGFGCINGMIFSGARACFAMAEDGLFLRGAARINRAHVPGAALGMQAVWTIFLMLVRSYNPATGAFGNLYSNLLDYVISAALLFYILTIAGVFVLRRRRPDAERPCKAFGYPFVPGLYIATASAILAILCVYRSSTTFPGMVIVLLGVPVYLIFRRTKKPHITEARANDG